MPPRVNVTNSLWRRARDLVGRRVLDRSRSETPQHMSIMVVDVTGFGRMDNRAQTRVRAVLNDVVPQVLRQAGLLAVAKVENRGDGMIVLVPATRSALDLLVPVIPAVAARVREHNRGTGPRIRLRLSVHFGVVDRDATGWVGSDLITACRLVDSPGLRRYLRQRPAEDLVVAVSDTIYLGFVRHGYRDLDPTAYEPLHVSVKELNTRAWVHVPTVAERAS